MEITRSNYRSQEGHAGRTSLNSFRRLPTSGLSKWLHVVSTKDLLCMRPAAQKEILPMPHHALNSCRGMESWYLNLLQSCASRSGVCCAIPRAGSPERVSLLLARGRARPTIIISGRQTKCMFHFEQTHVEGIRCAALRRQC